MLSNIKKSVEFKNASMYMKMWASKVNIKHQNWCKVLR